MSKYIEKLFYKNNKLIYIMCVFFIFTLIFSLIKIEFYEEINIKKEIFDFHAFYVSGYLYWKGNLSDAYHAVSLFKSQRQILGADGFMPWTYPPHFNLLTSILALMPLWLGYVLFTTFSTVFYLYALRSLAKDYFFFVILAVFPAIIICITIGQSGMLFAGFMAIFAKLALQNNKFAGVPLAFMTIKPHFLPLTGLYLLLHKNWSIIVVAGVFTSILLLISTVIFGIDIWRHFVSAVGEAKQFLTAGLYPFHHMTSIFAFLSRLGVSANIAFICQTAMALSWVAATIWAFRKKWPQHHLLALIFMGSIFLSPYSYDYDLVILGVALALVVEDLLNNANAKELCAIIFMLWVGTFLGVVLSDTIQSGSAIEDAEKNGMLSLGILFLLPACIWILRIIRRNRIR